MKLLTEYIEHALQFERLAAQETEPRLRCLFENRREIIESLLLLAPGNTGYQLQARHQKHKIN